MTTPTTRGGPIFFPTIIAENAKGDPETWVLITRQKLGEDEAIQVARIDASKIDEAVAALLTKRGYERVLT